MNDWMFSTIKTKDLDNEIDKILSRSLVDAVYDCRFRTYKK